MKSLLRSNIYETQSTTIIVGSCLKYVQPKAYKELEKISSCIFDLCLEESHINMAITKICDMLRTKQIKKLVFASVDKSPHCTGLHYIRNEIEKIMDLKQIELINYVSVDNKLIEISSDTIQLSRNLSKLEKIGRS